VTTTVWDDALTAEDRRVLDPGAPEHLDATPDVLVVGGGVIGLATAAFCRRAGLDRVVVVERGRLASGPSGRAAGTLTPGIHALIKPDAFVGLAMRGLELHRELDREWGGAAGFRTVDSLISPPVLPPTELMERAGATVIDGLAAREIEPEFGEVERAVHIPEQASVRPLSFAAELAKRAGTVATGVEVRGLECDGGRVTRVRTSYGDLSAGAVVVCTGTAGEIDVPQLRVKGHMLATEPAPFRLRTLPAGLTGLVQIADGRIVAGGTFDPGDDSEDVREPVIEEMLAEVHRLVPRAKELGVSHRWTCFRPAVADELPVIDRLPDVENAWASIGHFRTGIMVAPAAAELVARWITTGERPEDAVPFGAGRFG
jgi:glycine/D-amino acid oxidase-like deaminating enzyme